MKELLSKITEIFSKEKADEFVEIYKKLEKYFVPNKIFNKEFANKLMNSTIDNKLDYYSIILCVIYTILKTNPDCENEVLSFVNNEVKKMYQALIKVETIKFSNEANADFGRNMFISIAKDLRVVIIKLCIEVEKLNYLTNMSDSEIAVLMQDITDLYAPLSSMLGMSKLKNDLENATFLYYKPTLYAELSQALNKHVNERNDEIQSMIKQIKFEIEPIISNVVVYGRQKQLYSIAKKLQSKNMGVNAIIDVYGRQKNLDKITENKTFKDANLNQIMDILAIRILVNNVEECYTVLGKIFTIFKPLGNFKDYIAHPKDNGYQSLHTAIVLDNGDPVEIQIRTFEMHNYAEYGLAAHWAYKEKKKVDDSGKRINYVRSILEMYKDKTNEELKEVLLTDVYKGKIFVQTPKGKIIEFTEGSTLIDFAYAIHSSIGNKCVGAKINGKMAPLSTLLNNGDIVEIITNSNSKGPSRDWLKLAKNNVTKSKIRAFFKSSMKSENIKKGKSIFESTAKLKLYNLQNIMQNKYLKEIFDKYTFLSIEDMYASIGFGSITSLQILNKLNNLYKEDEKLEKIKNNTNVLHKEKYRGDVNVKGFNELYVKLGQCCNPIPGDNIIGYISRGNGVTVHRIDCENIRDCEFERLIECNWNSNQNKSFIGAINIICMKNSNNMQNITKKINDQKLPIVSIKSNIIAEKEIIHLQVLIKTKIELNDLINKIVSLSNVESISRTA